MSRGKKRGKQPRKTSAARRLAIKPETSAAEPKPARKFGLQGKSNFILFPVVHICDSEAVLRRA